MSSSDPYFDQGLAFFWLRENDGEPLHTTPKDSGGATSWGIVFRYWSSWRHEHGEASSFDDFAAMPRDGFRPYLYSQYWLATRCQDLGVVGIAVFDMAGTSGTHWAAKLLQRAVGVGEDGAIGPLTLAAVASIEPAELLRRYCDVRIAYYQSLAQAADFPGWAPRARRCRDFALRLPAAAEPVAKPPAPPDSPPMLAGSDDIDATIAHALAEAATGRTVVLAEALDSVILRLQTISDGIRASNAA